MWWPTHRNYGHLALLLSAEKRAAESVIKIVRGTGLMKLRNVAGNVKCSEIGLNMFEGRVRESWLVNYEHHYVVRRYSTTH